MRRAKLFYLRKKSGKNAKIKELRGGQAIVQSERKKDIEASKEAAATSKEAVA